MHSEFRPKDTTGLNCAVIERQAPLGSMLFTPDNLTSGVHGAVVLYDRISMQKTPTVLLRVMCMPKGSYVVIQRQADG